MLCTLQRILYSDLRTHSIIVTVTVCVLGRTVGRESGAAS